MTLAAVLLCVAAVPVWPEGRESEMSGFYRFRANVVSESAAQGVLRATAGYAYRARVNGAFVGYGPARSAPGAFRVDEWPVALSAGTNVVEPLTVLPFGSVTAKVAAPLIAPAAGTRTLAVAAPRQKPFCFCGTNATV